MTSLSNSFFETTEGKKLYQQSIDLYNQIERDHAHTIELPDGVTMGYLDFGEPSAMPLVWCHGSSYTSYEIVNVQAALVTAGYRVIAIDYRGHGKTQIADFSKNTSLYHIADDIRFLLNALGISAAVIGGLSKGAWIAAAFYHSYPSQVLGLLLEDGGSWSNLRLLEELQLGEVQAGEPPYPLSKYENLCDTSIIYSDRLAALRVAFGLYSECITVRPTAEYLVHLLAMFYQTHEGRWRYHCDVLQLMADKNSQVSKKIDKGFPRFYSQVPLMQLSQELMIPAVIFRNLSVPLHIIDPVSPTDYLDVYQQNAELQAQHPEWIVHETYDYSHSPHEAHLQRPDRFIESATALMSRINCCHRRGKGQ